MDTPPYLVLVGDGPDCLLFGRRGLTTARLDGLFRLGQDTGHLHDLHDRALEGVVLLVAREGGVVEPRGLPLAVLPEAVGQVGDQIARFRVLLDAHALDGYAVGEHSGGQQELAMLLLRLARLTQEHVGQAEGLSALDREDQAVTAEDVLRTQLRVVIHLGDGHASHDGVLVPVLGIGCPGGECRRIDGVGLVRNVRKLIRHVGSFRIAVGRNP